MKERGAHRWKPGLVNWLGAHVLFEPAHFIMERKMMLGVKERAEAPRRCVGGTLDVAA